MARFYANENFPLPVVEELRKLRHDVLTIQEAGKAEQEIPDDQVLAFASEDKRAVLTFNRKHFKKLHKARIAHEGVIACTFDLDFPGLAKRIHDTFTPYRNLTGKLILINRPAK